MSNCQGVGVEVRWGGYSVRAFATAEAAESVLRWMPLALGGCEVQLRPGLVGADDVKQWSDGVCLMDSLVAELTKFGAGKGN